MTISSMAAANRPAAGTHISPRATSTPKRDKRLTGAREKIAFEIFLKEIDDRLKRALTGPDQERDRTIFWLYFRQGMSTKEIASLPAMGLGLKGVGSVLERVKHCIREQILRARGDADDFAESKSPGELVISLSGLSDRGTSLA
jgi:hypothetical protein